MYSNSLVQLLVMVNTNNQLLNVNELFDGTNLTSPSSYLNNMVVIVTFFDTLETFVNDN